MAKYFCKHCGAATTAVSQPRFCSGCGEGFLSSTKKVTKKKTVAKPKKKKTYSEEESPLRFHIDEEEEPRSLEIDPNDEDYGFGEVSVLSVQRDTWGNVSQQKKQGKFNRPQNSKEENLKAFKEEASAVHARVKKHNIGRE